MSGKKIRVVSNIFEYWKKHFFTLSRGKIRNLAAKQTLAMVTNVKLVVISKAFLFSGGAKSLLMIMTLC